MANKNSVKKIEKIDMKGFDELPTAHQLAVIIFKMEEIIDAVNENSFKTKQSKTSKKSKAPKKKGREARILELQKQKLKQIREKKQKT